MVDCFVGEGGPPDFHIIHAHTHAFATCRCHELVEKIKQISRYCFVNKNIYIYIVKGYDTGLTANYDQL